MVFSLARSRILVGFLILSSASGMGFYIQSRQSPDIRELWSIQEEWNGIKGKADAPSKNRLATRCVELARKHPGYVSGLTALLMASTRAADTAVGTEAGELLVAQVKTSDVDTIVKAFERSFDWPKSLRELPVALMTKARSQPDHPRTPFLLASVCRLTNPRDEGEPPAIYTEAADLIVEKYAASPEICHFVEGLNASFAGSTLWVARFEKHLRAILKVNQDRLVRCTSKLALAQLVQASAEDRQAEAETLYEEFCTEFDGKFRYPAQSIEEQYHFVATRELAELRSRAVGMPAPLLAGVDLDDRPLKLSDYRGRVVLLNFWGTWCFPCMKLVPHERDLVAAFEGQPFDVIGVNCADEPAKAREAVKRNKMSWRSFRNEVDGQTALTKEWKILGFPTLYLIDHHGVIRKRWVGAPPVEELSHMTRVLVDAARQKVALDAMRPVIERLPLPASTVNPAPVESPAAMSSSFVEKAYRGPDGSESKYVVYVPKSYDGTKAFPAILSLHGSGSRGADGKRHIEYGFAKAIRGKAEGVPFIVIFPQAREGENWTVASAGGKRALAILDQVQADYRIDTNRVVLTGVSMGGEGTWSLAAAYPTRWSSIVPICHGGDTKTVSRFKDVPCWCFHGDADKMIPVQQSREMIQALNDAGGHPLYQEFIGVGHNDCSDRVYAMADLYEWMLMQDRTKR